MNFHKYNPLYSAQDNFDIVCGEADFHKKVSDNMRTQRDALRAMLESLNIPKEEIDRVQFAHINRYNSDISTNSTNRRLPSSQDT